MHKSLHRKALVVFLFLLIFKNASAQAPSEYFQGMVQIFGNEEGTALLTSHSWTPFTKTLYTAIPDLFKAPVAPGTVREFYLVIRKGDNINSCADGPSFRFWYPYLGKAGHEFVVEKDWGTPEQGTVRWVKIPNNWTQVAAIANRDGTGTPHYQHYYWQLDAKIPSTCSGSSMKVYSVFVAAVDKVGGSSPSIALNNEPVAPQNPRFVTGGHGGRIVTVGNGNIGIGTLTPSATFTFGNTDVVGEIGRIGFDISTFQRAYIGAYRHTAAGQLTDLYFGTMGAEHMRINSSGNVGIGTTTPAAKLTVDGGVLAKRVKVSQTLTWPDYVFEPTYKLTPLDELEEYVTKNKHLPGVPSAAEVAEKGLDLGDNQAALLQKIEELTLYIFELKKELAKKENKK